MLYVGRQALNNVLFTKIYQVCMFFLVTIHINTRIIFYTTCYCESTITKITDVSSENLKMFLSRVCVVIQFIFNQNTFEY